MHDVDRLVMTAGTPVLVRKNRKTGYEVLLYDRRPSGAWEVVCGVHGAFVQRGTRKEAVAEMATPGGWCSKCAFEIENGPPEAGMEVCSGCIEHFAPSGYPAFGRCGPCRGMTEEEGLLKIPGAAFLDADTGELRAAINDGRLAAYLFRKLWRRAEAIRTAEQHMEVVDIVIDELARLVAGDADLTHVSVEEFAQFLIDAIETEQDDVG